MTRTHLLCVATAFALSACSSAEDPRMSWTILAPLPQGASIDEDSVSLPVGTTISARPTPMHVKACVPSVRSEDESVLAAHEADRGSFALLGNSVGETTLTVECGERSFVIAGRVTP